MLLQDTFLFMNKKWGLFRIFRLLHRFGISRSKLRRSKLHYWLGDHFLSKKLWTFQRDPVAKAFLIGSITAFSPFLGIQVLISVLLCIYFRANVPIAFALQWITNPVTMGIYYPLACIFGAKLLGKEEPAHFTIEGLLSNWSQMLQDVGLALFVGCSFIGLSVGLTSYVLVLLLWKKKPR